jgi:hypothetical protein
MLMLRCATVLTCGRLVGLLLGGVCGEVRGAENERSAAGGCAEAGGWTEGALMFSSPISSAIGWSLLADGW